jgi:hypothetical protein
VAGVISPISSKNKVPAVRQLETALTPSAAPVNAPFS